MKNIQYTITDENGIHARPAGIIVSAAKKYASDIKIEVKSSADEIKCADAKKLFAVMALGAKKGNVLDITVSGEDEAAAIAHLETEMRIAGL